MIRQDSMKKEVAGARNQGALAANGDILAFTDADCIVSKDWLGKMAEIYAENAGIIGVGGVLLPLNMNLITQFMHPVHTTPLSEGANCSFRRDFFIQIGGFNERYRVWS